MVPCMVGVDQTVTREMATAFYTALRQSGLQLGAVAAAMGIASHQLSDQLAGRGLLSEPRLLMLRWNRDPDFRAFYQFYQHELQKRDGEHSQQEWLLSELKSVALRWIDEMQKRVPVKADLRAGAKTEVA